MAEQRVRKHLIPAFGALRVTQLSSTHIKAYKLRRKKDAANATVNRELELLLRTLKVGYEREPPLVLRVPKIEMLPGQNVREGILEHESYLRLREFMLSAGYPPYCLLLVVGYHDARGRIAFDSMAASRSEGKRNPFEGANDQNEKGSRPACLRGNEVLA